MPATRFSVIPSDLDERLHDVEIILEERGGRQVQGLLTLAVKVLRKAIIEGVNHDYNHIWQTRTANRKIQIQPYVRDTISGLKWSLHRYIKLKELTWEILEEVIKMQSGDKTEIEYLGFGCYIRRTSVEEGEGKYTGNPIPGVDSTSLYANGKDCAIIALIYANTSKEVKEIKRKKVIKQEIQNTGWDKDEPVTRLMLQEYHFTNEKYKDRRLAMFTYPQKQATLLNDFSYYGDDDIDKITDYILYIPGKNEMCGHFAAIRQPKAYLKHVNSGTTMTFCNKCVTGLIHPQVCRCNSEQIGGRKRKMLESKQCVVCDQEYTREDHHVHYHYWCQICNQQIPKELYKSHRHVVHKPLSANDEALIYDEVRYGNQEIFDEECLQDDTFPEHLFNEYEDEKFNPVAVYAWDIEVLFKTSDKLYNIRDLNENEGGDIVLSTRSSKLDEHVVVHIACENIFTNEKKDFTGLDAVSDFLDYAILETHKKVEVPPSKDSNFPKMVKRKTIWYAHNSMGYDSHFVHQGLLKKGRPTKITNNGNKLLALQAGSMLFIDSLNHIRSSLDKAVEDFGFLGMKGFVPYKFWRIENIDYFGPIPPYSYFENCRVDSTKLKQWYDMHSVMDQIRGYAYYDWPEKVKGNPKDPGIDMNGYVIFPYIKNIFNELLHVVTKINDIPSNLTGYDDGFYWVYCVPNNRKNNIVNRLPNTGTYNLRKEMAIYCRNDVSLLAQLIKTYHEVIYKTTGITPLGTVTSAGVAHNIFLKKYLPGAVKLELDRRGLENNIENQAKIGWAVQEAEEWAIASKCMHGGNTGVRREYVECTPEQKGVAIDISSSYPDKQFDKIFPIGSPTMEIYDRDYYPCKQHYLTVNNCGCTYEKRKASVNPKLIIVEKPQQNNFNIDDFKTTKGFICCDITPNTSDYHPMIFQFDSKTKKNVADCLPKKACWITFPELVEAVKRRYKIGKVYMISRYEQATSYWSKMISDLVAIRVGSKGADDLAHSKRIEQMWKEKCGEQFKVEWAEGYIKNPALNQTIKIILNSIWGKAAETIYRGKKFTINETNFARMEELICNLEKGKYVKFHQFHMNNMLVISVQEKFEHKLTQRPDLTRQYMPAACYVTTYGRLHLQEMLDYYERDVVLYDTDSVYAVSSKLIPKTGKVLGDWELEDCCTKGAEMKILTTAGPKFYGYKYTYPVKWKTTKPIREKCVIKAKGVRLDGVAHDDMTWDKFVDLCVGRRKDIKVRQPLNFVVRPEEGLMLTQPIVKIARAPREGPQPKGVWKNGTLYPFGFEV